MCNNENLENFYLLCEIMEKFNLNYFQLPKQDKEKYKDYKIIIDEVQPSKDRVVRLEKPVSDLNKCNCNCHNKQKEKNQCNNKKEILKSFVGFIDLEEK